MNKYPVEAAELLGIGEHTQENVVTSTKKARRPQEKKTCL